MVDDMRASAGYATLALKASAMERIEEALRTVEADGGPHVVLLAADADVSNDQGSTCTWVRLYRPARQTTTIGGKLRLPDFEWAEEHLAKGFLLVFRADANHAPAKALRSYMGRATGLVLGLGEYVQRQIAPPANKDYVWRKTWRALGLLDDQPGPCVGVCWLADERLHLAASHHGQSCEVDVPPSSAWPVDAHPEWGWITPSVAASRVAPSLLASDAGEVAAPEQPSLADALADDTVAVAARGRLGNAQAAATSPVSSTNVPGDEDGYVGTRPVMPILNAPAASPKSANDEPQGAAIGAQDTIVDSAPGSILETPDQISAVGPPTTPERPDAGAKRRWIGLVLSLLLVGAVIAARIWWPSDPEAEVAADDKDDATVIVINGDAARDGTGGEELAVSEGQDAHVADVKGGEEAGATEAEAEKERVARAKAERKRVARAKAERERVARAKAERERAARAKAERERAARAKAERERAARAETERERAVPAEAERERAARAEAERERAARAEAESERVAKAKVDDGRRDADEGREGRIDFTEKWPEAPRAAPAARLDEQPAIGPDEGTKLRRIANRVCGQESCKAEYLRAVSDQRLAEYCDQINRMNPSQEYLQFAKAVQDELRSRTQLFGAECSGRLK